MKLSEITAALRDRRLDIVAKGTGLSVQTIRRVRDGEAKDPAHSTVAALEAYLTREP